MLALAILSFTGVAAVGGPWAATLDDRKSNPGYAWMSRAQLDEFDGFVLYWLGPEFDGLELYAIVREVEPYHEGQASGRDSVDFLYGDCHASGGGCPLPLAVQVWPACRRNLSMYEYGGRPMPHEALWLRGVPAARFDDFDGRLELYTGDVTIVVFGDSPERIEKAALGLRSAGALSIDGGSGPGEPLPAPVEGALEGRLSCNAG